MVSQPHGRAVSCKMRILKDYYRFTETLVVINSALVTNDLNFLGLMSKYVDCYFSELILGEFNGN